MEKRVVAEYVCLNNNFIMKIEPKNIVYLKKYCNFASNICAMYCMYFYTESFKTNNNTPLMPLFDAHLRGFFFLYHE
jgi:hypothetical protein